jgi:hypothetical protein
MTSVMVLADDAAPVSKAVQERITSDNCNEFKMLGPVLEHSGPRKMLSTILILGSPVSVLSFFLMIFGYRPLGTPPRYAFCKYLSVM